MTITWIQISFYVSLDRKTASFLNTHHVLHNTLPQSQNYFWFFFFFFFFFWGGGGGGVQWREGVGWKFWTTPCTMNIFKTANNYVCHLQQVLFHVLPDLYRNLTLRTHYISVARQIITIATENKHISLKYDENASSDIILPIKVVICLVIASSCDIFYFSCHYDTVAKEKTALSNQICHFGS